MLVVPAKVQNRAEVCAELWRQFAAFADDHHDATIFIEEPLVGRNVKSSLMIAQVYGVVIATARNAGMTVYPVNVSTWKRDTCGAGNASKDMVADWLGAAHPLASALCGRDQDLTDAACIALSGLSRL